MAKSIKISKKLVKNLLPTIVVGLAAAIMLILAFTVYGATYRGDKFFGFVKLRDLIFGNGRVKTVVDDYVSYGNYGGGVSIFGLASFVLCCLSLVFALASFIKKGKILSVISSVTLMLSGISMCFLLKAGGKVFIENAILGNGWQYFTDFFQGMGLSVGVYIYALLGIWAGVCSLALILFPLKK